MNKNCTTGNRTDMMAIKMAAAAILPLIGFALFPLRSVPQKGGVLDVAKVLPVQEAGTPSGSLTADDAISEAVITDQVNYTCGLVQVAKAVKHGNIADRPGFTVADSETKVAPNLKEAIAYKHESEAAAAMFALATAQSVVVADTGAEFIAAVKAAKESIRKYAGVTVLVTNRTNFFSKICLIPAIQDALTASGIQVTATIADLRNSDTEQLILTQVSSALGIKILLGEDSISCVDEEGTPVTLAGWAPSGNITIGEGQAAVDYAKSAVCFVAKMPSMMDVMDENSKPVLGFTGMYDDAPSEVAMPANVGDMDSIRAYSAAMLDQFVNINSQPDILKAGGINKYTGISYMDLIVANGGAVVAIAGADKISLS